MSIKTKKSLLKLKNDLYTITTLQKRQAWYEKDYNKSIALRKKEKLNYQKWEFMKNLLNEMEKHNDNK